MSLSRTRENRQQNLNHTEDEPFLLPLEPGYQLIAEYECVCNYDAYDTGIEERMNGCGVVYTRRISISPSGIIHNERTHCKCSLEYLRGSMQDPKKLEKEKACLKLRLNQLFQGWNLLSDDMSKHMRFEKFKPESPSQKKALELLKSWLPEKGGVCLAGLPGRGKTHLAIATANKMSYLGYSVLVIKSIDLLNRLRRCYSSKDSNLELEIMDTLKNLDVLVIDDIGTEKPTGWVLEKLYEIIDSRMGRKATIFTTNLNGDEMQAKLGHALTSRIYGAGFLLTIEGRDFRTFNNPFADWSDIGTEVNRKTS